MLSCRTTTLQKVSKPRSICSCCFSIKVVYLTPFLCEMGCEHNQFFVSG